MIEQKPKSDGKTNSRWYQYYKYDSPQSDRSWRSALTKACEVLSTQSVRKSVSTITLLSVFSVPVAAQATNEASDVMCSSGLGPVITLAFGMITLGMILLSAFRGAIAVNKMGSARSDKKKEGREALKGAIITFLGAWFFPLFAVVIDKAGVSTLSCVNFANIM
ncbi:hypothetical protein [Haladaptatus sp. DYF46]|uniref:hypothetical protein n=1 Tax=Haladaptatus sp. DYF46 TaxID=2886041 RepID=UPI001E61D9A8|nr:hypothetical protein [Haladaptatus sp. DYF46]